MKAITILIHIIFISFVSISTFGQANILIQTRVSSPNPSCGNAAGQLVVDCGSCTVTRWQEGTLAPGPLPRVFTVINQYSGSDTYYYNVTAPGTKAFRAYYITTGNVTESISNPIEIIADEIPVAGTLTTTSTSFLNSGSGQLVLTGSKGTLAWGSDNTNATVDGSGNFSISQTTNFYASLSNGACNGTLAATSNAVKVEVFKAGVLSGNPLFTEGNKLVLTVSSNYSNIIRWEYSTNGGTSWTNFDYFSYWNSPFTNDKVADTHEISTNTQFRVLVNLGPYGTGYTNTLNVTFTSYKQANANPTNGGNYVREQQVVARGITDPLLVDGLTYLQKHEVVTYMDAEGRPVQQNVRKGSPLQKDLVSVSAYDGFGRNASQYLPYVSALDDAAYRTTSFTEQASFYINGTADKVADSPYPFASTVFEMSPLGRATEQGSVGQQWQPGGGHSNLVTYSNNIASEVWLFNSIGGTATYYGVNELTKLESTDADMKKNQRFTDKAGRTILTRVQLDETVNGTLMPWLETYYIYNELGGVKYMLPPKGVDALKTASWVLSQAIIDQYAHQFIYDVRGRLIEKKVPGQAWSYYCYDRLDRLVLMQDGSIRNANKWLYLKYDRKGRPVMQGLYTNTTYTTRATLQLNVVDLLYPLDTDIFYEERGTIVHGYTNQIFPTTNTQVLTVNYYDNYDFDNNGTDDYAYVAQGLANENTPTTVVRGLPTGSKRLVLDGGTTWLYNYAFYDADGHTIQVRSNNHLNPTVIDNLTTAVYDFEGKLTLAKNYHNAGTGKVTTVINKYTYDHMGRLKEIYQNNNSAPSDQMVVQYAYNELGQNVTKMLHYVPGPFPFLQSVDLRYSIQGWLTSINNAQLTNDGSNPYEPTDYFGMELLYEKTETGLTASTDVFYNGNISAVKWKGAGAVGGVDNQSSYKFTYDKANRLRSATSQLNTGTLWTKEANALNESTSTVAGTSGYDLNGNIISLQRNQRKHQLVGTVASYSSEIIDNLTYTYNSSIVDQLQKVTDAAARTEGFDNGTSSTNTDYTYENASTGNTNLYTGNLLSDLNKGISSITYNHLGKPTLISFTDTRKIEYTYDAGGTKLTMKTYKVGPVLLSTTDYVNGFVYQDAVLSFFGSPEGRVVNNSGTLEYQYAIADNQGNTRIVFSSVNPTKAPTVATFEDAVADAQVFKNVSTSSTFWVSKSAANNTSPGTYVMRMNNTYNPSGTAPGIGPGKSFSVFPGDVVDMEVWAYYEGSTGFGGTSQSLSTLIASVASVFTAGLPAGEVTAITNGVTSAYSAFGAPGNQSDTKPSAYLNYILLDKNYKLLDMGYQPVPSTANMAKQKVSFTPRNIKEAGFMYVYLSYEGQGTNWVYFDDLKITHTKTNVIQYNEYYPFGLQASTSWTRDQTTGNNYLYNEANELNPTTGWYEMFFRNYDPTIGRFTAIDPLAAKYASLSSYHYSYNNPIMFNDPSGAEDTYSHAGDYGNQGGPLPGPGYPGGPPPGTPSGPNAPTSGNAFDDMWDMMTGKGYIDNYYQNLAQHGSEHGEPIYGYRPVYGPNGKQTLTVSWEKYLKGYKTVQTQGGGTNDPVHEFLNSAAGSQFNKFGDKITWVYEGDPNSTTNVTKGVSNPGVTRSRGGKTTIFINSFAFSDPGWTHLVFGHELVHAELFLNGQFTKWALKYDQVMAEAISEFYAYSWQSQAAYELGINDHGAKQTVINYVPFIPMSAIIEFSKR